MRRLQELTDSLQDKVIRAAITKACKEVVRAAKAMVPVEYGHLKKSIGYVIRKYKRSTQFGSNVGRFRARGTILGVIGARKEVKATLGTRQKGKNKGKAIIRWPAKYAHLVEHGTSPHSLTTGVDTKAIRRGGTVWNDAARKLMSKMDPNDGRRERLEKRVARIAARKYLYRRDRDEGKKVHPGARPKPFLGPAFRASKQNVLSIFRQEIAAGIAREATKMWAKKSA